MRECGSAFPRNPVVTRGNLEEKREFYGKRVEVGLAESRVECGTLEEWLQIFTTDETKKEGTLRSRQITGNM